MVAISYRQYVRYMFTVLTSPSMWLPLGDYCSGLEKSIDKAIDHDYKFIHLCSLFTIPVYSSYRINTQDIVVDRRISSVYQGKFEDRKRVGRIKSLYYMDLIKEQEKSDQ